MKTTSILAVLAIGCALSSCDKSDVEKAKASAKETTAELSDSAKKAGDKISEKSKEGLEKAKEGAKDLKEKTADGLDKAADKLRESDK